MKNENIFLWKTGMTEENTKELNEEETLQEQIQEESTETSEETHEDSETQESTGETFDVKSSEEYSDLNNKYLRLHAEFDNYRRRTARENLELIERANAKILAELCEVLENFDRALETESGAESHEEFLKGVNLISGQFSGILKDFGLEIINPEGAAFDPNEHEALMQQPSEEIEADHILQVFQKGYKVKDKVIRHAKVIVSAGA